MQSVAFSPDGQHFASASADTRILFWRMAPYTAYSLPVGADLDGASQVAFSPDGKYLATGSCDGKLRLWDVATGKRAALLSDPSLPVECINVLAFSPDGKQLVGGTTTGDAQVWDLTTQQLRVTCTCEEGVLDELAISPDGRYLVSVGDDLSNVTLWDMATQQKVHEFTNGGPGGIQRGAAFSPDGRILAVGDTQGRVALWDMRAGTTTAALATEGSAAASVAFSPDDRTLAVLGLDGGVALWDARTWKLSARLPAQQSQLSYPIRLSFGPDSQTLIVSQGRTIALWNTATRQLIAHPFFEQNQVLSAVISPDGRLLASSEGPVIVRYARVDLWQAEACQIANRNLSRGEWAALIGNQLPYQTICPGLPAPTP